MTFGPDCSSKVSITAAALTARHLVPDGFRLAQNVFDALKGGSRFGSNDEKNTRLALNEKTRDR